jgi:hypothetical protein
MIWIIILVLLGIGVFALQGSVRNSFKNVELKNSKARMARTLLGEEGYRYFVGLLGVGFIVASLALLFLVMGGGQLLKGKGKTDTIEISLISEDPSTKTMIMATEEQIKMKYDVFGDREFDKYQHISLKDNYRSTLPELLWRMKNIESIDLTNNEFTELPLSELTKLPKLKRLILDGNPMDEGYLQQVRSALSGIEVLKNDIVKP